MGRVSTGVKGIGLQADDEVVDMVVSTADETERASLLTICQNGYGKRTDGYEYPRIRRGGRGVIDIKTTERNGNVVACKQVFDEDEVMVVTQNGIMIRTSVGGISRIGRNTQGVRVINLDQDDQVIDMTRVAQSSQEEVDGPADNGDGSPTDGSSTDSGNGREDGGDPEQA